MGIFVRPATLRAASIFSAARERRQVLVCELEVASKKPNALLVPLPAAAGPGSVEKLDQAGFPLGPDGRRFFFADLQDYFVAPPRRAGEGQVFLRSPAPPDDVELVESPSSLARLEKDLRPQPALQVILEQRYGSHLFALHRLPAGLSHAFVAVRFEPRDGERIFFPMLQVPDGRKAAPTATYVHALYAQGAKLDERMLPFHVRMLPAGSAQPEKPPAPPFPSFIDVRAPIDLATRWGKHPNEDLLAGLAPPGR